MVKLPRVETTGGRNSNTRVFTRMECSNCVNLVHSMPMLTQRPEDGSDGPITSAFI